MRTNSGSLDFLCEAAARHLHTVCVTTLPRHCPTLHTHEKLHHLRMDLGHNSYNFMAWLPPLPVTGHLL